MLERAAAAVAEMPAGRLGARLALGEPGDGARGDAFAVACGNARDDTVARHGVRHEDARAVGQVRDAVAARADLLDLDLDLGAQAHGPVRRAAIRNSLLPSGPVIGLSVDAEHGPARLRAEPGGDARADRLVQRRVAHDAALADLRRADLELRLDQRDETRAGRRQRQRRPAARSRGR